jgi:cytochrome c oxidase subunit IV
MHEEPNVQEHIVGYGTYVFIWLGLIAFTGITVVAAGINLGVWTVFVALGIASVKSLMVMNVFMHLKFEDKIFKIFAGVAFATLAIFLTLTFADYLFVR